MVDMSHPTWQLERRTQIQGREHGCQGGGGHLGHECWLDETVLGEAVRHTTRRELHVSPCPRVPATENTQWDVKRAA